MKRSIKLELNMILFCALCWSLYGPVSQAEAQQLSIQAVVEQQEVFLGQSFIFQIQISGSDSPEAPNVEAIADFDVESLGGRINNSQSVTVINGRMNRVIRRGYTFSYRLTPKRLELLSRPLRVEPAPFLCAMILAPYLSRVTTFFYPATISSMRKRV